jgi:hypothetical protein
MIMCSDRFYCADKDLVTIQTAQHLDPSHLHKILGRPLPMFPISDTIFRVDIGGTDITLDSLEAHLKAANQIMKDSIGPALFLALWTQMGDRRPVYVKSSPPNFLPDPFKTGRVVAQPGFVYITGVRVEVDSKANITTLLQAFNIGPNELPSWVKGISGS